MLWRTGKGEFGRGYFMRIGIAGPIGTENIAHLIGGDFSAIPVGYRGAPLMASLICELLNRGHEVIAFTTSTDISSPVSITSSTHPFSINYAPSRSHGYLYRNGSLGKAMDAFGQERYWLQKAMLETHPDLIHAHWTYEFALAALDAGIPHLITCHDAPQNVLRYMPNVYRLVRYFMARRVLQRAVAVTAVSPYLKKMIQPYARSEIRVIPNPVPANLFNRKPSDENRNTEAPCIVMVLNGWGSLKNSKNGIKAFSIIHETIPGAVLHIYGTDYGPDGKASRWSRRHNLTSGITFFGPIPHEDLMVRISQADLVIHPSLEETFGMSVAEAMATGVPVIGGVNSGAVPWVIGNGGCTVNVLDHKMIAETAINLLRDATRLATMSIVARDETMNRFSTHSVANSYEELYRNIVRRSH